MPDHLDEELRAIARGLPPTPTIKPHAGNGASPGYDFERLGQQVADGLVQSAEEQLLRAQNFLEEAKAFAADVHARIAGKAHELSDLNNRLKIFGASILAAHQAFNSEPAPDDNAS